MKLTYFRVYADFIGIAEALDNGERGKLFLALLQYVNGEEPDTLAGGTKIAFLSIKAQIDREASSISDVSSVRSEAGKKGAQARWQKQNPAEQAEQCDDEWQLPFCHMANMASDGKHGNNKDEDKDEDKDKESKGAHARRTPFSPPSFDEVSEYCQKRGNDVNPAQFVDFYAAKGWKVGRNPMVDWKAAVRTWEQRAKKEKAENSKNSNIFYEIGKERGVF